MPAPKKQLTAADRALWETSLGLVFPRKPWLRPDEAAGPLGIDDRTAIRLMVKDGRSDQKRPWLMGIEYCAGEGERTTRRINRDAAILFWALSANYDPNELLGLFLDALEKRTAAELLAISHRCHALLKLRA